MTTLYAIFSYYGGWCRLYQYSATQYLDEAQRLLNTARNNHPNARLSIREIEEA